MHGTLPAVASRGPTRTGWVSWLSRCLVRARERRLLSGLDDDQLKDIGLTRADVARECGRWPWDGRPRD